MNDPINTNEPPEGGLPDTSGSASEIMTCHQCGGDFPIHKRSSCACFEPRWIKATDINKPGEYYWVALDGEEDPCPQIVFVTIVDDGDAAPDFEVIGMGELPRIPIRLKAYVENGWTFLHIPNPSRQNVNMLAPADFARTLSRS